MIGHRAGPGRPLRPTAAPVVAIIIVAGVLLLAGCGGTTRLATPEPARHEDSGATDTSWMHGGIPGKHESTRPPFCDTADDLKSVSRMVDRHTLAKAKQSVSLVYAIVRKAADQAPEEIADALHTIRDAYAEFNDAVQHAKTQSDLTDAGAELDDHEGLSDAGDQVESYIADHCSATAES